MDKVRYGTVLTFSKYCSSLLYTYVENGSSNHTIIQVKLVNVPDIMHLLLFIENIVFIMKYIFYLNHCPHRVQLQWWVNRRPFPLLFRLNHLPSISSTFYACVFCTKFWRQSLNVTRKRTFVRKKHVKNVDEIDTCACSGSQMTLCCALMTSQNWNTFLFIWNEACEKLE